MGMKPKTPDKAILELLEIAEAEIQLREQSNDERPTFVSLETIQKLKWQLEWSDKNSEKLLVEALGVGFLLGVTAPGSRDERLKKAEKLGLALDRTNKDNPGRPKSIVRNAMKDLATKINYPPRCNDAQFIKLIQEYYPTIRGLIEKPKTGDNFIFPKDSSKPKKLSTAKNYLQLASKK